MRSDDLHAERLEAALHDLEVWTPPPDFSRRVVARVPIAELRRPSAARSHALAIIDGLAKGLIGVAAAYLVVVAAVALAAFSAIYAAPAMGVYKILLEQAIGALMTHSVLVTWSSAALSLGVGLSVRLR